MQRIVDMADVYSVSAGRVRWRSQAPQAKVAGPDTAARRLGYVSASGTRRERPQAAGERSRKIGNAPERRGMIQLTWRFLRFQKDGALARWYRSRTDSGARKTTMIVALARKLLIELWRMVTTGKVPEGVVLHAAWLASVNGGDRSTRFRHPSVLATATDHGPRWRNPTLTPAPGRPPAKLLPSRLTPTRSSPQRPKPMKSATFSSYRWPIPQPR
jgi:hypothetical protein